MIDQKVYLDALVATCHLNALMIQEREVADIYNPNYIIIARRISSDLDIVKCDGHYATFLQFDSFERANDFLRNHGELITKASPVIFGLL